MLESEYQEAYQAHVGRWGVGATLRGAREAGGESLIEVSDALRIRSEYLLALEEEDYQRLPGWAYAISYVRTYAEYLGLDPKPLVRHVKEKFALREHLYADSVATERRSGPRRILFGAVLPIVALVVAGAWLLQPSNDVGAVFDPVPRQIKALIDRSFYSVAEVDDPASAEPTLLLSARPEGPGETAEATLAPSGTDEAVLRDTVDETRETVMMSTHPRGATDRNGEPLRQVILRARASVWLTVEDSTGGVLLAQQMRRGQLYRVPRETGLLVSADDGAAVEYYVEGELGGVLGQANGGLSRLPIASLTVPAAGG